MNDNLASDKKRQFDELVAIFKKLENLQTVDLQALLLNLKEADKHTDEFTQSLKRLLVRFGDDFHLALKEAGIGGVAEDLAQKTDIAEEPVLDEFQHELISKPEIPTDRPPPRGYENWGVKDFIENEGKTVAVWSGTGIYKTGEILSNTKLKEFYFQPVKGEPFILTQGHKNRVDPSINNFYFKKTKKVF
ncbi:MAG: hypothetical protein OEY59_07240 [Deltaproteobacteria bacterium]|nr:hypothetical protein [Deltaproteobacteria bacterium]